MFLCCVMSISCSDKSSYGDSQRVSEFFSVDPLPVPESSKRHNQVQSDGDLSLDVGIVDATLSSYICIPLARTGVDFASGIATLTSSCECVKPSLVKYINENKKWEDALRLHFVPDETVHSSSRLSVVVKMTSIDSRVNAVRVNFIHAAQVESLAAGSDIPNE